MLKIELKEFELFDEVKSEFIQLPAIELSLEHSLVSLSKWESKHERPFLTSDKKTPEETLSYIQAMSLNQELTDDILVRFTNEHLNQINQYIESKQTATWFTDLDTKKKANSEVVTSELIYYWMVSLSIPFECQHWHLNRLLTLIKVVNLKQSPPKKMSRAEMAARNKALNEQRKAKLNTSG